MTATKQATRRTCQAVNIGVLIDEYARGAIGPTIFCNGVMCSFFAVSRAMCIPGSWSTLDEFLSAQYLHQFSQRRGAWQRGRTFPFPRPICPVSTCRLSWRRTRLESCGSS